MPAQSQWLLRLPQIIAELARLSIPVVDRSIFETLFGVRRRRAHQLMHHFGGYQAGRTFLIERGALLRQLERVQAGDVFSRERARKERLSAELEKIRRIAAASKVTVTVQPEVMNARIPDLPAGVRLEPGMLMVSFQSAEELLERLFVLAQVLSNDFDRLGDVFGQPACHKS